MTSTQPAPSHQAALNVLSSKLRHGNDQHGSEGGASSGSSRLPPLGTRTIPIGKSPPSATQPAPPVMHADSTPSSSSSSSSAGPTPLPPLTPLPPPKPLTNDELSRTNFTPPRKRIVSDRHMQIWKDSSTFNEVLGFIMYCNDSIVGLKLTDSYIPGQDSKSVQSILSILDRISAFVDETPAEKESTSRFGNPAFRTFYRKVQENSQELHRSIDGMQEAAIVEVEKYLIESFGNEKRIDYGSGMELNFACWLLCLVKLDVLKLTSEAPAIVLRIFWSYITVMRKVQSTYWLEPAGSHGVWGLDDYHFLPFLFGSAQLRNHKHLKPKAIHDEEILDEFAKEYMYFACIRFINSIKTASLRWHSPMLDDISGVRTWAKVNEGMLKMYKAEVLLKLPIAQHFFFGALLPYPDVAGGQDGLDSEEAEELHKLEANAEHCDEHGHVHTAGSAQDAGWGDCCGIPIPSAFAAAQEEQKKQSGIRRIPFD